MVPMTRFLRPAMVQMTRFLRPAMVQMTRFLRPAMVQMTRFLSSAMAPMTLFLRPTMALTIRSGTPEGRFGTHDRVTTKCGGPVVRAWSWSGKAFSCPPRHRPLAGGPCLSAQVLPT